MNKLKNRLIIVSNRLPIVVGKDEEGKIDIQPGSGGLVTALVPVLKNRGGVWIGWSGSTDEDIHAEIQDLLKKNEKEYGYTLKCISLNQEEMEKFYLGYSNEILWPLFHDMPMQCNLVPSYWHCYEEVNKKFARNIIKESNKNDYIWIHDYHLITAGSEIRKIRENARIGFFLHIPFPSLDLFLKLPQRSQIIRALLEYDLIGFQTERDQRNFFQCLNALFPQIKKFLYPTRKPGVHLPLQLTLSSYANGKRRTQTR